VEVEPGRWRRFVEHVAHARAKPTFDAEEREYRLDLARGLREALHSDSFLDACRALFPGRLSAFAGPYNVIGWNNLSWMEEWSAQDPQSFDRGLEVFRRATGDPEQRFERFAEAAGTSHDPAWVLAAGSLLNFALEPGVLPIVRAGIYRRAGGAAGPSYAEHLDFARRLEAQLVEEGIPIRDMIDAEALIFIAAHQQVLWSTPPVRRTPAGNGAYLSVCAIYRDEAPYLREWIEFHRLAGVERFFLYDNRSSDDHREVLRPYLEDGSVVIEDWPQFPGQLEAYDHCIATHGSESRWIAFIDIDEFVFSPTGRPVPEQLRALEEWPGVGVNWALFGPSGHAEQPPGLVIENYVQRLITPQNRVIKSIVDPSRVSRCASAHHFLYEDGLAADENGYPIGPGHFTNSISIERLRVNHYYSKSESEFSRKRAGRRPDTGMGGVLHSEAATGEERDEAIVAYAPRVRGALADR
jgi:Glycosyltransferase family 92